MIKATVCKYLKHRDLADLNMSLKPLIADALEIESIEVDTFVAPKNKLWKPPAGRGVFGGQVIGQALAAATETVPKQFLVHSFHSYFLRPGDSSQPIVYKVKRERNGTSFITRSVNAVQNGVIIYMMICSFQLQETGFMLEHQVPMPQGVPDPSTLKNEEQSLREWSENELVPSKLRDAMKIRLAEPFPIEIVRTIPLKLLLSDEKLEPRQRIWIRAQGDLGDNQAFHQCVAAYASDHLFLATSLLPHGYAAAQRKLTHMASIDHSMWFHAPFRADEWLLFDVESPRTANHRGLVFGKLYTRDGRLVMSCSQEGLIRTRQPKAKL